MPPEKKQTLQSLAQQALGLRPGIPLAGPGEVGVDAAASAAASTSGDVDGLIDLYFACEDADERDLVFERLQHADPALTLPFFASMMQHDADDFLRAAAATVLAERGDSEALGVLVQILQAGGDAALFEQVVATLGPLVGAPLFAVLQAIWQDALRDPSERRAAMLGMEAVDADRSALAMVGFIESLHAVEALPEDQIEVAMGILARQPSDSGLVALEALDSRIATMSCADADAREDRDELRAFVREGINLVQSALAPP